jgi:hypothetical protein
MFSLERRIKMEPTTTVNPEKIIIPLYDPWPRTRRAPAEGPPIRDLEND